MQEEVENKGKIEQKKVRKKQCVETTKGGNKNKRVLKVGAVLKRKHVNLCRERRRESDLTKVKCQTYTHGE